MTKRGRSQMARHLSVEQVLEGSIPSAHPTEDTRLCRHCARPANRHGKYLGGCMQGGKALKTTFEAVDTRYSKG